MDVREKSSNGKRLIDVDEAIINFGFEWDDIPPTREEFVRFLKKRSIIDAVPVVRCLDCKHHYWEQEPCHGKVVHYCNLPHMSGVEVFKEFFCYYGERKEGDDNG